MRVNRVITLPKGYTGDCRTLDPVHRRRFLGKLGTGFVAWTAGCVAPTGTGDTTANDTNTTDTTATDTNTTDTTATDTNDTETSTEQTAHPHPIQIVCRSLDAASRTVTFELSTEAERIGTTTIQLGPQNSTTVDTSISKPGRYELVVSVTGGPTITRPFAIDDYDLRAGSNLIVELDGSDVTVVLQE